MTVIVEGPDNSGKSTLTEELANALGTTVIHSGGPVLDQHEADIREKVLYERPSNTLYDRIPLISEMIYGPIIRGVHFYTADSFKRFCLEKRPVVIYCRPPDKYLLDWSTHREGKFDTKHHTKSIKSNEGEIVEAYDQLFFEELVSLDRNPIIYNWTHTPPGYKNLIIDEILKMELGS